MDLRREVTAYWNNNGSPGWKMTVLVLSLLLLPMAVQARTSFVFPSPDADSNWPGTISGSFSSAPGVCTDCHTMNNFPSQFAADVGSRSASGATIEITRPSGASISNAHYWRYRMATGSWSTISNSGSRTETDTGNFEYCVIENVDGIGQGGERDWACGTFQISNAAPQISSVSSISVTAGESESLVVTATDDVAVTSLTAVSLNPQVATVSNSGSPFTVTALSGQQGNTAQITLTATDGDGAITTETVQVNVTAPANNDPTLSIDPSTSQTLTTGDSLSVQATGSDSDNDTLTYSADSSNSSVAAVSGGSGGSFSISAQQSGSATITFTVNDGRGGTDTETLSITVNDPANQQPSLSLNVNNNESLTVGGTLDVQATGTDADNDTLTYSASSANTGVATVTGGGSNNGSFTVTAVQAGSSVLSFEVSDGNGGSDTETVNLTVNTGANQSPTISLNVGGNVTVGVANTINVVATGSDPDGDSLTYSATSANSTTAVVVSDGSANGFNITGAIPGSTTVTFSVDDGRGESASTTVNVTVEAVAPENQNPTIALNPSSQQTVTVGGSFQVQVTVSDPDGDTLTTSAVSSNNSVVGVSGSGSSYTLSANAEGSASVEFVVNDGRGGVASQSIAVTVESDVNTPPVISLNPSGQQSVTVGTTLQVQVSVSDTDGDSLTTSASSANNAVVSVSGSGSAYTLSANAEGSTSVEFTVSDGRGGVASQSISVTVEPEQIVNTPPSLSLNSSASQTVALGSSLQISSSATDADGDTLTFSAQSLNQSIATVSGGGSTGDFTVQASSVGTTTIRISVSDGNGGSDSSDVQVTVEAPAPEDQDLDGVPDPVDNCPADANPVNASGQQPDTDGDGTGDVCDIDTDGNGSLDGVLQASVIQNSRIGSITFAADGQIDVVAGLTRGRTAQGTVVYDWSTSDSSLLAVSQTNPTTSCEGLSVLGDVCGRLQIDPSGLQAGIYRARFTLDANGLSTAGAIDVVVLSGGSGSFNDFSDTDGDGIPAFVDNEPGAADSIPLSTDTVDRRIRVESGSRISIGRFAALHSSDAGFNPTTALVRFDQFRAAAERIIPDLAVNDSSAPEAVSGVYNFKIITDSQAGQSLSAVMQLFDSVPANAQLRIFRSNNTWQSFINGADSVRAAVPIDGSCPVTSMQERWALVWGSGGNPSAASGTSCLFFQLQDGGANDADGQSNGVVSLVFSVGESLDCSDCGSGGPPDLELDPSDDGGGSAGVTTVMFLFALIILASIYRRRHIAFNAHKREL